MWLWIWGIRQVIPTYCHLKQENMTINQKKIGYSQPPGCANCIDMVGILAINLMWVMDTSPRWELRTTIHYSPVLDTFRWKVPIITGGFRTYWGSSYRFFVFKVNCRFCLSLPHVENIQPFGRELSPFDAGGCRVCLGWPVGPMCSSWWQVTSSH